MKDKPKILIIGSINMDMVIKANNFPKDGESIIGKEMNYIPGGKGANQSVAISRLNGDAVFCGRVGSDKWGEVLISKLIEDKVDISGIIEDKDLATGIAVIIIDNRGENRIITYPGANNSVNFQDVDRLLNDSCDFDAVLIQLEIPLDTVYYIIHKASKFNIPVILDAGPAQAISLERLKGVTIISPNETEAEKLTGIEIENIEDTIRVSEIILNKTEARYVIVKLGHKGALIRDVNGYKIIDAFKVEPVDTTAAGDSFTGALALKYCMGASIEEAIIYANAVGAITVTRNGAQPSIPYYYEVESFLKGEAIHF